MGNGGNYYSLYLTATQAMATIALIICNCFLKSGPVYIVSECVELSFDTAWIPPDSAESYRLLRFSVLT